MFEVEKGLPVPKAVRAPRPSKYPWEELAVGDSFLVPTDTIKPGAVRNATWKANRTYPDRRFVTREVDGGTRVWRIA